MGLTAGRLGKLIEAFTLGAGLALSGCATTQLNTETCMADTGYQGRFLSYSSGTSFQEDCSLGRTAAATVNMRNKDGSLKPTAPLFDANFRKNLPSGAMLHYDSFLRQYGITKEALKEIMQNPPPKDHVAEQGLACEDVRGKKVCDFANTLKLEAK